ncbi:hypothetical protein HAX54_010649, partial [Datura stramonium]|nr:hypothetical protein [Datura stramonium]
KMELTKQDQGKNSARPHPRDQQHDAQPHLRYQRRDALAFQCYQRCNAAQLQRDGVWDTDQERCDGLRGASRVFKRPIKSNPISTRKRSYKSQIKSAKEQRRKKSIINTVISL